MPKLALANGLWIGITPTMLLKLTIVETIITHERCHTILVDLKHTNERSTTCQYKLKRNINDFCTRS
jgi:hypothetical protein